MFNPQTYQNSMPSGTAFMEAVQHFDPPKDPRRARALQPVFMPLKETCLGGSVSGPVARLRLSHRFGHPEGARGPVLEAVYRFPLPGDAAVTGVEVSFGSVVIRAELADRQNAEAQYDEARATGRQAILLSRESPDVFSLHVSGIEAGTDITVVTDFLKLLKADHTGFALRIPLTPAPRFASLAGRGGRHEHGQPISPMQDPGHRFSCDFSVLGSASVRSRTHEIDVDEVDGSQRVRLSQGVVIPDRDFVVEIAPPVESDRPALQTFTFESEFSYFLTLVQPPSEPVDDAEIGREIIILVDRSGSMSGAKWQAADWAVSRFLSSLRPIDYFSVGLFHDTTRWFTRTAIPASAENVQAARSFIDVYDDSGGTRLELAMGEALSCGRAPGDLARHVVVITDAQVSNARDNLELARIEAKRSDRRRISFLCIDAAPNSYLVEQLTSVGGGHASYLTSDPSEGDIATALDEVMELWSQPAATSLQLRVNRADVWVVGRDVSDVDHGDESSGLIDLGDLPGNRPLWVVGRCQNGSTPLEVELIDRSGNVVTVDRSPVRSDVSIRSLFGAGRINALEYQTEPTMFAQHTGRQSSASRTELRRQLVAESLDYGLVSSETSFVAVRQENGKLVERGALVPNAMPHGWAETDPVFSMADPGIRYSPLPSPPDVVLEADSGLVFQAESTGYADQRFESRSFRRKRQRVLFTGVPQFEGDKSVLADLENAPGSGILKSLTVSLDGDRGDIDGVLDLYVGDGDQPRASVRLRDVLRLGGTRPLNIRFSASDSIRLVLRDFVGSERVPVITAQLDWV